MKSLTSRLIRRMGMFGLSVQGKNESEKQTPWHVYQLQAVLWAAWQTQPAVFWALSTRDQVSAHGFFLISPTFESLSSSTGDLLCWGSNKFKQAWGTLSLLDTLISTCRSVSPSQIQGSTRITLAFADDKLGRQQDFGCMCCSRILVSKVCREPGHLLGIYFDTHYLRLK